MYHSDIDSEILRWRDGTWKCYSGGNGEGLKTVVGRYVQGWSGWGCMTENISVFGHILGFLAFKVFAGGAYL